ncbi:Undecaprenyl-phosphate glucose phosphotransferase [Methylocella tundrae]|uniref:Undecaprenyl-phosphate glucose phosphotransferase n=1 Tax=Methylocella tundrae TaxID=227605 RepID=A0A8B6M284_METTU|nr:undecaprenyl-phosphate glucose phosphotransferase [Methylocella tundrae]VTZ22771.1 Undecaprenyl-phosphate glucose phosphotransferase [Methylocella tundrae]VTZ48272.1 Undecaprenyl-phosphate glucose phosphotransferase [Methylocella tundrae]
MVSLVQSTIGRRAAKPFSTPVFIGVVRVLDFALFLFAACLAANGLAACFEAPLPGPSMLAAIIGASTGCAILASTGCYAIDRLRVAQTQMWGILKAVVLADGAVIACLFLANAQAPPLRAFPFAFAASGLLTLAGFRFALAALMRRWIQAGRFRRRIAVVAVSDFSREFIERLRTEPEAFEIVGIYDDRLRSGRVPATHANVAVRGSVADLVRDSREEKIELIAVALPLSAAQRILDVLEQLSSTVADVCLTTDLAGLAYRGHQFRVVGSNPVISIGENPLKDWRAAKKLCFDYVVGGLALIFLSPLFAMLALIIRLDSPGPILFRQPRLGFNNRMFVCYKFRTMYADMTDVMADRQTTRDDPRITRVGKWLRKSSLDELTQLFNVMNGTMSLVGPRPHAPNTKAADRLFADVVQQYALRHRVKPGITGWAQVNGWRGETTTIEQVENRVRCDLFYIDNWSVLFDIKIGVMTILREIHSENAF